MYKRESVQGNETKTILCYIEIKSYRLIQSRRPDLVVITMKKFAFKWILSSRGPHDRKEREYLIDT